MQPLISIIIPVYKVEKYIRECIDSVIAQTYQDWELILVDDGSPDRSGAICDEYAAKDSRISVYHKENGGVSSARNVGIEKTVGQWIMFIDSDDTLEADALSHSCLQLEEDTDIVIFGIRAIWVGINKTEDYNLRYIGTDASMQLQLEEADRNGWLRGPVNKLFKKQIIMEHHIEFDKTMSYGEDTKFTFDYLFHCDNIIFIPGLYYNYYFRDEASLTKRTLGWKYTLRLAETLKDVRIRVAEKFKMQTSYIEFIQFTYATWMTNVINSIIESGDSNRREIYNFYIRELKSDKFMRTYHPDFKKSRQYSIYTHVPTLWYYYKLLKSK